MADTLKNLLHMLFNVQEIVRWGGTLLVCTIIFVETGLFVGFFLPGDSLLVTAGIFAAAGTLNIFWLLLPVSLCAIAGDQLGYWIGRNLGQRLYQREDSRFFKRRHLENAHAFYEKHGGMTIVMARFVPIIRTFCPPVAGAARMSYARYLTYDIFGGLLWVWGMILTGYFLGRAVPHIDKQIHWVIAAVIVLSLIPVVMQALKARRSGRLS
jgi:membrane-associated protein